MYVLTVKDHFDAAHSLRGYDGECQRLHGHTWDVEVSVEGGELDGIGILYDFKRLKEDLGSVLHDFDHRHLDDVPPFDEMNATAENLARVVFKRLTDIVGPAVRVTEVAVWESPIARLVYRPERS
jgi:6-pyruvoyltetrahydropterin/6-carboxytetrahydropterin synthase